MAVLRVSLVQLEVGYLARAHEPGATGTGTVSLAYYVIPVVFHRIFVQMIKRYHLRTLI